MLFLNMCYIYITKFLEYIYPFKYCDNELLKEKNKFYYLSLKRDNIDIPWSIHGLWPQYSNNSYPSYCSNRKFDYSKLELLIDELDKYWYSTNGDKNETFWKHEWEKHGTCMFNNSDEFDYFKTALSLFVETLQKDVIKSYPLEKNGLQVKIPFTQDFKIIPNDK